MSRNTTGGRKLPSSNTGASIKPKAKKPKWQAAATAVSQSAKSASGTSEAGATPMDSDTQAYKQMGDAGASIAKTYKDKQAAKSSSSNSSGR